MVETSSGCGTSKILAEEVTSPENSFIMIYYSRSQVQHKSQPANMKAKANSVNLHEACDSCRSRWTSQVAFRKHT